MRCVSTQRRDSKQAPPQSPLVARRVTCSTTSFVDPRPRSVKHRCGPRSPAPAGCNFARAASWLVRNGHCIRWPVVTSRCGAPSLRVAAHKLFSVAPRRFQSLARQRRCRDLQSLARQRHTDAFSLGTPARAWWPLPNNPLQLTKAGRCQWGLLEGRRVASFARHLPAPHATLAAPRTGLCS